MNGKQVVLESEDPRSVRILEIPSGVEVVIRPTAEAKKLFRTQEVRMTAQDRIDLIVKHTQRNIPEFDPEQYKDASLRSMEAIHQLHRTYVREAWHDQERKIIPKTVYLDMDRAASKFDVDMANWMLTQPSWKYQVATHTIRFHSPDNHYVDETLRLSAVGSAVVTDSEMGGGWAHTNELFVDEVVETLDGIAELKRWGNQFEMSTSDIENQLSKHNTAMFIWRKIPDDVIDCFAKPMTVDTTKE